MDIIYIYSTMYTFYLFELIIRLRKQIKKYMYIIKKKNRRKVRFHKKCKIVVYILYTYK